MRRITDGTGPGRRSYNGRSHHMTVSEMTKEEHFMWCEKKREEARRYRERAKQNKADSGSLRT
jgi:hypothetical protein